MRLDEWQKFIESQFLDDKALAAEKAAKAEADRAHSPVPIYDTNGPEAEHSELSAQPSPSENEVGLAEFEAAETSGTPQPAVKTTLQQSGFIVRTVVSPEEALPELPPVMPVTFGDARDFDADMPDFADYLPSKTPMHQDAQEAVNRAEVHNTEGVSSIETGPVSVLLPLMSGFVLPLAGSSPDPAVRRSVAASSSPVRRRARAPQARNVPPETSTDRPHSSDLWSKVPRHVQTLLALERMEEEREVAQASYKRPFQEKRAELVARILDPILSLEDTARLLNVCPTTVRRYTNKGILTHYRKETDRPSENASEKETRQRRFRLSDVLSFLETQQLALETDRSKERVPPARRRRSLEEASDLQAQE